MSRIDEIMKKARSIYLAIPAFNIPYLAMMEPVAKALKDKGTFGIIAVARLEWLKFQSKSIEAVAEAYYRVCNEKYTSLHLDHIPVIDEDNLQVDYMSDIKRAISAGYSSVMIDGSRLELEENIKRVSEVVQYSHSFDVPVEGELGAVFGHESGLMPDYEELFRTGRGFTDLNEAEIMVEQTGLDWLSVAVGSVHGAISAARTEQKISARVNIKHLSTLNDLLGIPLVLHGGSGITEEYLKNSFLNGITKLNIATDIRQPFEKHFNVSIDKAQDAVYDAVCKILDTLGMNSSLDRLNVGDKK